ncbi:hypothetical protein N665_0532s0075 [Sinapis alba]|nr:hypothetical protein N665_0532s0075 [Sinapis alba]
MFSPTRCCLLKGKGIATASNSDNSSSPWLLGPRAITLGGMILRPTNEDLAELNKNERSAIQFSLELEEREASGQITVDEVMQETIPSSQPESHPDTAKDKASAEKAISLALADLLPMRWTGTDFEFDEEIDPEQERRLSVKKNQRWENHFPTRSTFKIVRRLVLQTSPLAGFSFLIPTDHQRPWTPPAGYAYVYESWFTNCSLWWPLPEFLMTYCHRRRIALGQYTANGIRILVTLTVLVAELGITMSVRLFEELTTPSITARTWFFYGKMVPKYNVITGKPSKSELLEPGLLLHRLSKWSQGGTQSFLEEVEAIRTLSHQHWPDISEARIQAALNRINRAAFTSPNRSSRMEKLNLASLPSYADTIGTPVHGDGSSGAGRPAKRKRSANVEEEARQTSPAQSPYTEGPIETVDDVGQQQGLSQEEPLLLSPATPADAITATEMPTEECLADPQATETCGEQSTEPDLAGREEVVGYPPIVDFWYQHTSRLFVKDNKAPARLFRQIQLKRMGMHELKQLSQSNRYREMTRAGAIFFGSVNLMVRDYEAKLKAQDEKIVSKTGALKKKRKEIAKLAYKCGSYEEQIGVLETEKKEAVERAELERSRNEVLSKELEDLKALKEGLDTRCHNLEQENAEIALRFKATTRRLRESREHEVKKERLRVESALKIQIAPVYDKIRQFVEEQPSIQSKLALYSQAKGIRESLKKIHTQGLPMDEILRQARADEAKYQGELQGMEIIEASEIDLAPIGVGEHGSNMAVFSPQDIEYLRS